MYKDSEPVTSPLITSDLPIVAWSAVVVVVLVTGRVTVGASLTAELVGVGMAGRSGSPGRVGVMG
jgi:hypothetical protein